MNASPGNTIIRGAGVIVIAAECRVGAGVKLVHTVPERIKIGTAKIKSARICVIAATGWTRRTGVLCETIATTAVITGAGAAVIANDGFIEALPIGITDIARTRVKVIAAYFGSQAGV